MKILFPFFILLTVKGFTQISPDSLLKYFVEREQKLVDAIGVADKAAWKVALHDSCIITVEDGSYITKQKMIEDLNPLPAAYKGRVKIIEPILKIYGYAAVITFIDDEYLELYGQKIHTQYRQTDAWTKVDGEWKVIAMQLFEIPKNPTSVSIPAAVLSKYIGTYELSSDRKCTISVQNGKLYAQKTDRDKIELLAETENVFFRTGDGRIRIIFIKEAKSKYRMIERRAGEDVVWKKIH